jgi:RNA polymerase sigma-32 factor
LKGAEKNLFYRIRKSRAKLGPNASDASVAEDTGIREEKVRDIDQRFSGGDTSLDAPVNPENTDGGARVDFIPAPDDCRPDVTIETEERDAVLKQKLRAFRDGLSVRKLEIFNRRFLSEDPETVEQVARRFYLSNARIRQIENQLKDELRLYLLDEFEEETLGIQAAG